MATYDFGPFRLETHERRLLRDGAVVALSGKAFDALVLLVEGAGALQRQQDLIGRLWPDTFVEPNNLQHNISLIRRVLKDVDGIELQTVRGEGYRLVAPVTRPGPPDHAPAHPRQDIRFCRAPDGTRLAYARTGAGPTIVKAANWLSHLEFDWHGELWTRWIEFLSHDRSLVRYDARGNGMSDWNPPSMTFEDYVSDLGAVFDAAEVKRAPLVGLSQGAAVAAAYAAQNPERVSALVLICGCARGWRVKNHPALTERFEAMMVLMRQGWGSRNAAFRQMFTSSFFPKGSPELIDGWNELQRQTTTPENAARLLSALGDVDIRAELARVRAPTLVLHSREDAVVPMSDGMELAAGIAGARFVPLDTANHVVLPGEPAWRHLTTEVDRFLAQHRLS